MCLVIRFVFLYMKRVKVYMAIYMIWSTMQSDSHEPDACFRIDKYIYVCTH